MHFGLSARVLAIGAAMMVSFAACGGSGSNSSASTGQDGGTAAGGAAKQDPSSHACDLVTKAEAEAILKASIAAPELDGYGCKYAASDPNTSKETITAFGGSLRSSFDESKKRAKSPQDVSGLGDAAYCDRDAAATVPVSQLEVYSKGKGVIFTVTGDSCDEDKLFAERILSRL